MIAKANCRTDGTTTYAAKAGFFALLAASILSAALSTSAEAQTFIDADVLPGTVTARPNDGVLQTCSVDNGNGASETTPCIDIDDLGQPGADSVGSVEITNNSVTGADIRNGTVTGTDIANGSVTGTDIADESVTGTDIADETITGTNIQDGTVTGSDIADGGVENINLGDNSIDSRTIEDQSIQNVDLGDNSINSRTIEDQSVQNVDLGDNSINSRTIEDQSVQNVDLGDNSVNSRTIEDQSVQNVDLGDDSVNSRTIEDRSVQNDDLADGSVNSRTIENDSILLEDLNGEVRQFFDNGNANTLRQANAYTDRRVDALEDRVNRNAEIANDGIAMALAAKVPSLADGHTEAFSIGLGHYAGSTAIAAAGTARLEGTNAQVYGTLGYGFRGNRLGVSMGVIFSR